MRTTVDDVTSGTSRRRNSSQLTYNELNKIAIQATAEMVADKEAVGLSRVHI